MKTLILFRHGKAEPHNFELKDFERKLVTRGKEEVAQTAELLKKILQPNQIVSSPAARAFETAKIISDVYYIKEKDILIEDKIYDASMQTLLYIINHLDDDKDCILMTGHNPGFEYAVEYFTSESSFRLRTSGAAIIRFPFESWKMVSSGTGDLVQIIQRD